jgi:hypothetical protein
MVCKITVLEDTLGDVIAEIDGVPIPQDVFSRSTVLQDLLTSQGTATIPVTLEAWSSWVAFPGDTSLSLQSSLCILQVRAQDVYCTHLIAHVHSSLHTSWSRSVESVS